MDYREFLYLFSKEVKLQTNRREIKKAEVSLSRSKSFMQAHNRKGRF